MFDLDVGKMLVVGIVALAVIPPKDLPRVMRTVGQAVGKMRRMAAEFQGQFMDAIREADLESVKKEFEAIQEQAKVDVAFDPAGMIRDDVTKAVQAPVEVGTSEIALNPPGPTPPPRETPAEIESDLENVRKELEALNEKAKLNASFDPAAMIRQEDTKAAAPHNVAASEIAGNPADPAPPPHGTVTAVEAPAVKQSAAE